MLTATEHKTYQFVCEFFVQRGYAPTTAEIATGIGIKSRGVVYRYLKALAAKKLIRLIAGQRRNIEILNRFALPLLGQIVAGKSIEAIPETRYIDIAELLLGNNRFVLKVKGDSMIEEGIFDGDIIVCDKSTTAADGEIVVALVNRAEVIVKRIQYNDDNTITLLPANATHAPMVCATDCIEIQGIFRALIRYHMK